MLKNYLKIAWRSLCKNKGYSALNIFGLAIGITCASLIFLWVEDEINLDSVFLKQDTVYYLPTNQNYEGEWRTFYSKPGPLAADLKNEIPELPYLSLGGRCIAGLKALPIISKSIYGYLQSPVWPRSVSRC